MTARRRNPATAAPGPRGPPGRLRTGRTAAPRLATAPPPNPRWVSPVRYCARAPEAATPQGIPPRCAGGPCGSPLGPIRAVGGRRLAPAGRLRRQVAAGHACGPLALAPHGRRLGPSRHPDPRPLPASSPRRAMQKSASAPKQSREAVGHKGRPNRGLAKEDFCGGHLGRLRSVPRVVRPAPSVQPRPPATGSPQPVVAAHSCPLVVSLRH